MLPPRLVTSTSASLTAAAELSALALSVASVVALVSMMAAAESANPAVVVMVAALLEIYAAGAPW